jgi:DNA-binding LacI/PurR family transcriptional regulator
MLATVMLATVMLATVMLATVAIPSGAIGEQALNLLLAALEKGHAPPTVMIGLELVIRASTAALVRHIAITT